MSVHHHQHDWLSSDYVDGWVANWSGLEHRQAQLRRLAVALPFASSEPIAVLDLGCGWGPVSEQVLACRPRAMVTLADLSPRMLEHARTRLAPYAQRCRFQELDLSDPGWPKSLGRSFDAVVTSLAIHNLGEPEQIARVYADVRRLLGPGGCFLNLELALPAGPGVAEMDRRLRAEADGSEPDSGGPAGAGGGDHHTLQSQLDWLRAAGFGEVDCLWREGEMALLCACP